MITRSYYLLCVSKTAIGGIILVAGLLTLALLATVAPLPAGLKFIAYFLFAIAPIAVGVALIWTGWRGSAGSSPEVQEKANIKDQIIWQALAKGGHITVSEVADLVDLLPSDAELVLMSLVAEGRAAAEPKDSGEVVYRIESVIAGPSEELEGD